MRGQPPGAFGVGSAPISTSSRSSTPRTLPQRTVGPAESRLGETRCIQDESATQASVRTELVRARDAGPCSEPENHSNFGRSRLAHKAGEMNSWLPKVASLGRAGSKRAHRWRKLGSHESRSRRVVFLVARVSRVGRRRQSTASFPGPGFRILVWC